MAREERAAADQWLTRVRARLPETGTAAVIVRRLARRCFLVSLRANAYGESLLSEAKADTPEHGLEQAGARLLELLAQHPPRPRARLRDRVKRLFRDAA